MVQAGATNNPAKHAMMETGPVIQRQKTFQDLQGFAQSLAGSLIQAGITPDKLRDAFVQTLSGECEQCGTGVGGEELYLLAQPAEAGKQGARIIRLRKGYCAREGCTSNFCRVAFAPLATLDWSKVLDESVRAAVARSEESDTPQPSPDLRRTAHRRLAVRAGFIILAAIVLFIFRQWYFGGTIPFIREPERFKVDVNEHEPGLPPK